MSFTPKRPRPDPTNGRIRRVSIEGNIGECGGLVVAGRRFSLNGFVFRTLAGRVTSAVT